LVNLNLQESALDVIITNSDKVGFEKEFNCMSDHCVLKLEVKKHNTRIKSNRIVECVNWNFDQEKANEFF